MVKFVPLLFLCISVAACSKGKSQEYSDDPYMGSVHVRIEGEGVKTKREEGNGSAHFIDSTGGWAKLVVFGAIRDTAGDAGFSIDGKYSGKAWSADSKMVDLKISEEGVISGLGTIPGNKIGFSGKMDQSKIDLTVKMETLEVTAGGYPAGTTFTFRYLLRRQTLKNEADEKGSTAGSGRPCKRIRWQARNIWTPGGGMQMIQVPVCY